MLVPIERAQSNMLLKAAVKYHCADLLGLFYPDFPWDVLPLPVSPFFPHVRSRTFISLHVWWCSTCFEQKLWWRFRRWRKTVINLTQNTYNFKKMTNFAEKNWGTYKLFVVPYIDSHFCPYSQLQKFSWLEPNFSTNRINSNHQQAYKLLLVADYSIFRIVFPWTKCSDLATDRNGSWCRML